MKQSLLCTILLSFSFILIFFACKKNTDPTKNAVLPPATQEGKNTIGFTVNGEVWVPYAKCGVGSDPCGEISANYSFPLSSFNGIGFQFTRVRNNKSSTLTISSLTNGTITSVGNKIDSISIDFQDENWSGNGGIYGGPRPGSKFIITKIDPQNQIISGDFEFVLLEQNASGKEIILKEGRFDFKFNTCKCSSN